MIKDEFFSNQKGKIFLSQKRERNLKSSNLNFLKIGEDNKKGQIKKKKEKINSVKKSEYEKFSKIVEQFYLNNHGRKAIQDHCFICHMNNFLSHELLYFENKKYLFYYLKYIFLDNKNKLSIPNEIYLENRNDLINYKMHEFNSNVKFISPKVVCKSCFLKLIEKKNLIKTIIKMFIDKDKIFPENNKNEFEFSNKLYSVNFIEIKNNELGIDKQKKNNRNQNHKIEENILKIGINSQQLNKKKEFNFDFLNDIDINKLNKNQNENIANNTNYNIIKNSYYNNDRYFDNFISQYENNNINENNIYLDNNYINYNKNNTTINENYSKNTLEMNYNNNETKDIKKKYSIQSNGNINNKKNNNLNNNPFFISNFNKDNSSKNKENFIPSFYSENIQNNSTNNTKFFIENENINQKKKQDYRYNIDENMIKNLFQNNFPELILCLTELKEKISEIIQLSQQLKYQYEFLISCYPNLFDIIFCHRKSFFILYFVATSEIVNYLSLSHHYVSQRIIIISEIINIFENKTNLLSEEINEIKSLKKNIQNLYLKSEEINKIFKESMNNFLNFLKSFLLLDNQKINNE